MEYTNESSDALELEVKTERDTIGTNSTNSVFLIIRNMEKSFMISLTFPKFTISLRYVVLLSTFLIQEFNCMESSTTDEGLDCPMSPSDQSYEHCSINRSIFSSSFSSQLSSGEKC
jgi:hypothetical protein